MSPEKKKESNQTVRAPFSSGKEGKKADQSFTTEKRGVPPGAQRGGFVHPGEKGKVKTSGQKLKKKSHGEVKKRPRITHHLGAIVRVEKNERSISQGERGEGEGFVHQRRKKKGFLIVVGA